MSALLRSFRDAEARVKLRGCAEIGRGTEARGGIWIHGPGTIRIGERVVLDGRSAPIELHAGPGAEIVIGDDVHVDGGASIEAQRSIRIGARSRVGRFCKLLDNHFHRTTEHDQRPSSEPIVVEEDALLGARSILLPGAHVGRATEIAAGTVLTKRVPPGVIVAGQPATVRRPP